MTTEMFIAVLGLVGAVIMFTALMSGWVERANLPQVAVFLLLGAVLGAQRIEARRQRLDCLSLGGMWLAAAGVAVQAALIDGCLLTLRTMAIVVPLETLRDHIAEAIATSVKA